MRVHRRPLRLAVVLAGLALATVSAGVPGGAASPGHAAPTYRQAAPALAPTADRATDPVTGGPFSMTLNGGVSTTAPNGDVLTTTQLRPSALVTVVARVTNTDDVPHDARVTMPLPEDGSLTEPVGQPIGGFSCVEEVCDVPAIAPDAEVVVMLTFRVQGDPSGQACLHATVAEGLGPVLATTPDLCFDRVPWEGGDDVGLAVGDTAPDLTLLDDTGAERSLSDYRGGFVVATFSAVWCGPSQLAAEQDRDDVASLGSSLGAPVHHLEILVDGPTPNRQSTVANAASWRNKFDLPEHVLATAADTELVATQMLSAYTPEAALVGYPTTVLLTPEGTIFDIRVGLGQPGALADLLEAHPPAPPPVLERGPRITGTPSLDGPLTGTTGRWDGATSFDHRWLRCDGDDCSPIAGATKAKYRPVKADRGRRLVHQVTAYRRETPATARSGIGAPRVSDVEVRGAPRVGETLRAAAKVAVEEHTAYRWLRNGTVVGKRASYRLTPDDRGERLTLRVVATNLLGTTTRSAQSDRVRG